MTKTELENYRKLLLNLRQRLTGDVSHLTDEALSSSSGDSNSNLSHVPIHMADLGSDSNDRDNTLSLLAAEKEILAEITLALQRIDLGSYGQCEECKGPILPRDRLKELPYTRYCVACARKLEP